MARFGTALFGKSLRKYGIGSIVFDLLLSENHNFTNTVTQYKIEEGSEITDHIRNELFTGTVSGLITNFSIFDPAFLQDKAQNGFDALFELWRARELVDVITFFRIYQNVAISNIQSTKSNSNGLVLEANISFQEAQIVKLKEIQVNAAVNLENMDSAQNRQSSPKLDGGKQQGVL